MNRQEILERLSRLPFDRGAYWLVAGAAMVLYGLREQTEDIDLGCSAALAGRLEAKGCPVRRTPDGKRCFRYDDKVEIFEEWLRDTTVLLDGYRVVSPEGLLEMKLALGREKDRRDIELLRAFLRGAESER